MQEAIFRMLERHSLRTVDEALGALREIIQEIALLGLWRARFFEHAAFYGGTALRILYGLDRFSEDLDFTLMEPQPDFRLERFTSQLEKEVAAFGFNARVTHRRKSVPSPVQSAFLKAGTRNLLLAIDVPSEMVEKIPHSQTLKLKIEVDTSPPNGFHTEVRYILQPVPFSVRVCSLPDLFAGKMHALLFRSWKKRVKGRDWYDFVWFASNYPGLHLHHLEQRMRQTRHWEGDLPLTEDAFREILDKVIDSLNVDRARREVLPFLKHPEAIKVWSRDFFRDLARRIIFKGRE